MDEIIKLFVGFFVVIYGLKFTIAILTKPIESTYKPFIAVMLLGAISGVFLIYKNGMLIQTLLAITGIGWLFYYLKSSRFKGKAGEYKVNNKLFKIYTDTDSKLLSDVTFLTETSSSQIDHIAITPCGVIVIETKNYNGKIFGRSSDYKWTQVLGRSKFKFYNPIKQNQKHIKELAKALNLEADVFINIVVILKANISNVAGHDELESPVTNLDKLGRAVGRFESNVFQKDDIDAIHRRIETLRLPAGKKTDKLHLENIRKSMIKPIKVK